jgi:PAS domain S-box-containing protein
MAVIKGFRFAMEYLSIPFSTIWIADPAARPQALIDRLARRHRKHTIAIVDPAAAAADLGLAAAQLAVLDLRPASRLDRALLPAIAGRLAARSCAALMLADEPGAGRVTPADLVLCFGAARAAARAAAASRARLARTWLALPGRLALATTLADGRVLGANAALLQLLGCDGLEALLGRSLAGFIVEREGAVAADRGDALGLHQGTAVQLRRVDGTRVAARLWSRPLRHRSGRAAGSEVALEELPGELHVRSSRDGRDGAVPEIAGQQRLAERLARLEREEQAILDTVPAFIWIKDRENRIRRINRYAAAALSLPEDQVAGRSTYELYPQEAGGYYRDDLDVMTTGIPKLGILERLETASGERLWLQTSKVPHFDEDGKVDGVIVLSIDVTAGHRAEEQLRLLESIAEQTREAIMVWSAATRRIVYVNPAVVSSTRHSRDELIGRAASTLLGAAVNLKELARLRRSIARGEPFLGEISYGVADGATGQVDLRVEPLRGAGGEITHWVALGRDLTVHKAAEKERERLRETISRSLAEWHQTFDSISLPVLLIEAGGAVGRLNEAARALAGVSFADCLQRRLEQLGRGEPWLTASRLAVAARAFGRLAPAAEQCASEGRSWEVRAQPLPTGGCVIVTMHDLTDLKRLQESVSRNATMSAMGLLVAGVAHEVRNPLFGLGALLDTFESQAEPRQAFPVEPFRRGLTRLQNLMQQLLDYGQPVPLVRSPQALARALREAVETCSSLARERQVEVVLAAPSDLPRVCIDESRIVQVFSNLLDNAIRHSPAGGRVRLSAAAGADWVECRVEDAGPGVAAADLAAIFEPFFTRRRGGTGLGLAIVQKIVVEHGGVVTCCVREGGGARMVVRLPLIGAGASATDTSAP